MAQVCATCWSCVPVAIERADGSKGAAGECHHNPPQTIVNGNGAMSVFPRVLPMSHWCRQWEPRFGFDERGEKVPVTETKPQIVINH